MSLRDKLPWKKKQVGHKTDLPAFDDEQIVNPFTTAYTEPDNIDSEPLNSNTDYVSEEDLSLDIELSDPNFELEDPELLAADHKDSRLKTFLNTLPKPNFDNGYQLLAFQTGSFGLRGGLIRNTRHGAILGAVAESRDVDFTRAIAEVLAQLKAQNKRLPKQAILITPSVISSIVDLPVSPLRPRADDEMRELIRWELEGTLTQQNKHWLIGSMLVERGYLTPSQRDELVEELKVRQNQGGQSSLLRFGDLAVQLNFITREQLEECFVLQGKLIAVDDDLAYGWQAEDPQADNLLSDEVLLSSEDDGDSAHKWLVCGMSKSVRRRWVGAFNLNGIKVQAFYPAVGSSFGLLSQHSLDPEQALLEVHQEQLAFIAGSDAAVTDIRVSERQMGSIRPDELKSLLGFLPADLKKLYINAPPSELEEIEFTLSMVTALELEALSLNRVEQPENLSFEPNMLLGIVGAADHFLKHIPATRLSSIPAKEQETALYKKLLTPKVMLSMAACLVVAAMLGFLGWMHWNMWQQDQRLQALNERFDKESKLKQQFQKIQSEQQQLKTSIANAKTEQAANNELLKSLAGEHIRDQASTRLLLKSLSVVTPENVFISSVKTTDMGVTVSGFSQSNTDGRLFVSAMNKALKPMMYEVSRSDVNRSDKAALPYVINVSLIKKRLPQSVQAQEVTAENQSKPAGEGS